MMSATTKEEQQSVAAIKGGPRLKLATWLEMIGAAVSWIAITLVCLLPVPILYDVVARTAGHPTDWAFEYTLYALIGGAFLANAWACKNGSHFRVTTLVNQFPRAKKIFDRIAFVMTLLFSGIVTYAGVLLVIYSFTNNVHSDSLLATPLYLPQALIPLGAGALFLEVLALLLRDEYPESHELI